MEDAGSSSNQFLKAWAWKREHRPDKARFDRPYRHLLQYPEPCSLTIHQARFGPEGFASTVWDSSIVLAKLAELQAAQAAGRWAGVRCVDLSAGCGLVGVVLAKLGAKVTATDLPGNLPLLRKNCDANGCQQVRVEPHEWGTSVAALHPPFDFIFACDVLYVAEAVRALVASLAALAGPTTVAYVAHGRNRTAEPAFLELCRKEGLEIEEVPSGELHPLYQCADVTVLRLRKRRRGAARMPPAAAG